MFLKFIVCFLMYLWLCDAAMFNDRFRSSDRQHNNARIMRTRPTICAPPKFYNGNIIPLRSGKMMKFECKKGYIREGENYVTCKNGRWEIDVLPICIKAGCSPIKSVDNGQINYINKKTTAILVCDPFYEAVGSAKSFCNGLVWDRAIGSCKESSNAPPLECDFETETICGYIHDNDNDLDFRRSSGYNNRTMTVATGPHADHTIGKAFEGHFMVINTNSQFANKKARLISQSYNLTQNENICIRFFYHMYGNSVGKLRIYQKPLSLNFEDVLIDDDVDDNEDKNKYLVFSKDGTQGNAWIEGGAFMKVLNESFQIVIEAVTGHTMMSDIAIDDISILLNDDCIDEDQATTPKMIEDDENILDVQSCVGRCYNDNVTMIKVVDATLLCNCNTDCILFFTCCPDFLDVCEDLASSSLIPTTVSTTVVVTTPTTVATTTTVTVPTTVATTTTVTVPTTVATTTTVTTPKREPTTKRVTVPTTTTTPTTVFIPTTIKKILYPLTITRTIPLKTTTTSTTTTTTTSKPIVITKTTSSTKQEPKRITVDKEIEIFQDIDDEDYNSIETLTPLEIAAKSSSPSKSSSSTNVIKFTLISLGLITAIAVIVFVAVKLYKSSTNPLNYKQNSGKTTTENVTEEFSEVRYLTEDECLDFNIASSESCLNST